VLARRQKVPDKASTQAAVNCLDQLASTTHFVAEKESVFFPVFFPFVPLL